MYKGNLKEISVYVSLTLVFSLCVFIFWGHLGNPVIDCGREAYVPKAMLEGSLLFKDILCIYGPFSYIFNALTYKFFGIHLNTLWATGTFFAFLILITFYLISRQFLSRLLSFSLCLFLISFCIFQGGIFNYIFPYAYAMPYSLLGFILSTLFLIQFVKEDRFIYAVLSSFFLGFSLVNKYDYLPLIFLLGGIFIFYKKLPRKNLAICAAALLFLPLATYIYLFIQGVTIFEVFQMSETVKKMASSPSISTLYKYSSGTYPSLVAMGLNLKQFFLTIFTLGITFALCLMSFVHRSKVLRIILILIASYLLWLMSSLLGAKTDAFSFLPILVLVLLLYNAKKYKQEPLYILLMLCAVLGSLKTFFHLQLIPYGTFTVPLLLVATFYSLQRFLESRLGQTPRQINLALSTTVIILCALGFYTAYSQNVIVNNGAIQTQRGKMYVNEFFADSHYEFMDYIERYTKQNDKIVILPEGPLVNFLTNRKSDDYYNSLIPLYFDTFGESFIIEHFQKNPPQYIVFNSRSTEDYGAKHICVDYAKSFCSWVFKNYEMVMYNGSHFRFIVYKRHEKK